MSSVALTQEHSANAIGNFERWMITIAVMLVAIIEIIDMTIVNVSLPQMMGELSCSSEQVTWVLTSYIVASAIFMPLTGFLVERLGTRRLLLINISGFLISSILCGLSNSLSQIVIFRTLQGSFGAGLVPLSQFILRASYSKADYPKAMAFWGIGVMTAPIIGPTLGGYLTETINWRWIFFINIPVCLLAIVMTAQFIRETPRKMNFIDWFGMALMGVGIAALQLFLDRGNTEDWFSSGLIWSFTFLWVGCLSLFFVRGIGYKRNIINLSIFRDRGFWVAELLMLLFSIGLIGLVSIEPLMLENIMGYPSINAGIIMAPGGIANALTLMTVNSVMKRIDARIILACGLLMIALSSYLMSTLTAVSGESTIMWYGVFQGIGMGFFFVPLATIAFNTLPDQYAAEGSGLFSFCRSLGASIGISILSTFITRQTQRHWNQLGEHITSFNPNFKAWLSSHGWNIQQSMALNNAATQVHIQAGMKAFLDAFMLIAILMICMMPLLLLLPKLNNTSSQAGLH